MWDFRDLAVPTLVAGSWAVVAIDLDTSPAPVERLVSTEARDSASFVADEVIAG